MWPEIRANYTDDVRDIFDVGHDIWNLEPEATRTAHFYSAVAWIMRDKSGKPCAEIAGWIEKLEREKVTWPQIRDRLNWKSGINGTSLP